MRKVRRRSSPEDLARWDLALEWDPVLDPVWDPVLDPAWDLVLDLAWDRDLVLAWRLDLVPTRS